ncbi:TetR/AcrR family transcriptional regulator [Streptomyces sp. NPDC001852]|uniref:TetR/AcrR family transcriptional regulator n=1 Tax=Streptomyces TaxID=1883 RepID=UPI003684A3CF
MTSAPVQTTFGAADASVRLASPGWAGPLGSAPCQTWASEAQVSIRPAVQRRGVERRRLILETAEALLGEQGYESATLRAIGERSGIPAASVHHYFSDRLHPPDIGVRGAHGRREAVRRAVRRGMGAGLRRGARVPGHGWPPGPGCALRACGRQRSCAA